MGWTPALVVVFFLVLLHGCFSQSCAAGNPCTPPNVGGKMDCGAASTCSIVPNSINGLAVNCNLTSSLCSGVSGWGTGVTITCGTLSGSSCTMQTLQADTSVNCRNAGACDLQFPGAPNAIVTTTASGSQTIVVSGGSAANAAPFASIDCGASALCNISNFQSTLVKCNAASTCIASLGAGSNFSCGNSGKCNITSLGGNSNVFCENAGICALGTFTGTPVTLWCKFGATCGASGPGLTVCYNSAGSDGTCFPTNSPPPTTALPTTAPPATTAAPATPAPTPAPTLPPPPTPAPPTPTTRPPSPSATVAPTPPPPPSATCTGSPPTPSATCIGGTWSVASIVIPTNGNITVNGSVSVQGNLVLAPNSTLEIVTGIGLQATTIDVNGCVDNSNSTLLVTFTDDLGDTRYVPVINSQCVQGTFGAVKVKAPSKCQRYRGESLYTGAQIAVLLQNDQSRCNTKSKKVLIAVIVVVIVVIGIAAGVALYIYRERQRKKRMADFNRRLSPNTAYTKMEDKPAKP